MITQLTIENYKSIQELTLDVGRVNVLIGENGCGKSNILEAITLAAAAAANKLDNEFLVNRGVRVTEPQLMRSIFSNNVRDNQKTQITFRFDFDGFKMPLSFMLFNNNSPYSNWLVMDVYKEKMEELINNEIINIISEELEKKIHEFKGSIDKLEIEKQLIQKTKNRIHTPINKEKNEIKNFIIYAPENSMLRDFSKEANIEPLGDKGEGLLKLLIVTQHEAKQSKDFNELNDIQETLELFGWFEKITIPNNHSQLEQKITLQDRYLTLPFDQRSANEGFLLVLFYITLVVSKYTPKIFAIDNIDASLNPKLCTKLIKELTRLAKKYDKQIFLTSHNPAILDGIDLGNDEQRLFVVSRNDQGHTCCDRLDLNDKPKSATKARLLKLFKDNPIITQKIEETFNNSEEPLKLSEAFLRGYLGGLPTGF